MSLNHFYLMFRMNLMSQMRLKNLMMQIYQQLRLYLLFLMNLRYLRYH
jgi:hypothetical protein